MSENNIAYFDNAATTFPKPEIVYSFMNEFYRSNGVNIGRGSSSSGKSAYRLQKETRDLLLDLFHCPGKQIIFEPSATIALNQVIRGLEWHEGDTVYITPFEHNAVLRPLTYLKDKYNLRVIELSVDKDTISYNLEKIKYQFQENAPKVVIATHASNVCGVIAPIERIFHLAKKYKAITIADMSQTAGLIDTNINDAQADFSIFAGHKTLYGPFGIAGFVATSEIPLKPLIYGGTGIESANPYMPEQVPIKFEAGSQNIMAISGLNASLKWIFETGIDELLKKDQENKEILLSTLELFDFINIIKPKDDCIGIVSTTIQGYSSDSLSALFSDKSIACRTGLQCAPTAHRFLGTFPSGTIRYSVSYFNTEQDYILLKKALMDTESIIY
ncbi:cysteine desulfurase family protein [Succinivibrio dextrinosolvens DSM 3072]|uniref:Cysteine desulfurase family protein n=1 Tax=Succinivibrio dextrinosolvens DSM 3072 TaxID=1123324 RepID=A0A1T4V7J2_9GAMM|nr:aminotransferase class V-fold PLP-dependent enzyme [Succinivibrio dextrinosolvens]SKA60904.1 cysteine desulfurase family protein [Succinivibrio dextrinosolvens DSM 3072]